MNAIEELNSMLQYVINVELMFALQEYLVYKHIEVIKPQTIQKLSPCFNIYPFLR